MAAAPSTQNVEETIKRIQSHRGVEGVVIMSTDGVPIRTTLDKEKTIQFAALFSHLASKAGSLIKKINDRDSLQVLRLRSVKHEIIITPEGDYILVVVQNPRRS